MAPSIDRVSKWSNAPDKNTPEIVQMHIIEHLIHVTKSKYYINQTSHTFRHSTGAELFLRFHFLPGFISEMLCVYFHVFWMVHWFQRSALFILTIISWAKIHIWLCRMVSSVMISGQGALRVGPVTSCITAHCICTRFHWRTSSICK